MSQCGGSAPPRDAAFAIAALGAITASGVRLYMTRSKVRAAFDLVCGTLGFYVGGALGWVYYIAPSTLRIAFGEFVRGLMADC